MKRSHTISRYSVCLSVGAKRTLVLAALALLGAGPAARAANLTVTGDSVFIDNRRATDPLLTGLNLQLNVDVTDAVGGTSPEAHRAALERIGGTRRSPTVLLSQMGFGWAR